VSEDIRMPRMNGYELAKQVKSIDSEVRVILMSSFELLDNDLLNVLPDLKVDAFIQKPFSSVELIDIIERYIKK
jgi:YesN/AraC family two-component response regulator